MYDLIIIGGGPAAAAASVYALGKQLNFLVIYAEPGKAGRTQQLTGESGAEFLPGADAVRLFEHQVLMHAGRALRDRVTEVAKEPGGFRVTTQHHGAHVSAAVIVATGATPIVLDVPGARKLIGYGLGYSITTHAHLMEGKHVAVIGATIRALRGVAELACTAAQVYLIPPSITGLQTPLAYAPRRRLNVEILEGYEVTEVVGTTSIEQLVVARDGQVRRLNVDAVFVDLGLVPNSGIVRDIAQTDGDGFICVDERNATMTPGLFAAGDVTTAFGEQILIAIGDGARAAISSYDYLLASQPTTPGPID
jgi:thioredoxin reductase (NADPH)